MKELIKQYLKEFSEKKIKCKKCGWEWKKSDGGPDMYFCHKCGNDNTPDNIKENEKPLKRAAGVLVKCTDTDRIFLMLRNDEKPTWSLIAGGINEGESIIEGLKREIVEETSIDPNLINFKKISINEGYDKKSMFHYYEGFTNSEFIPKLDHENLKYGWFSKDNLPSPLFIGMEEKIKNI
jgi:8-oxo-dGTP pyrophosphatase MutT (NUDIX family)